MKIPHDFVYENGLTKGEVEQMIIRLYKSGAIERTKFGKFFNDEFFGFGLLWIVIFVVLIVLSYLLVVK